MIRLNLEAQTSQKLRRLTGAKCYDFLGFTLNLEENTLTDNLNSKLVKNLTEAHIPVLSTLLSHYASANPTPLTGKLVKFKDLPGGCAYEGAFQRRAVQPVADCFGEKPERLVDAAELLEGTQRSYGDASVEITALKGISLTYILWEADEFAAVANILYDQSASNYLPTEDLAVLGELTTSRLMEAKKFLNNQ